ncbi:MAG: lipid kinase [Nocardioidaceae bacterium]|nr:lipid kinase [Nocardioidaceae bacterium]NUS51338.1 lipid kinase [Nocardioidaceae bacterium]
MSPVALGKAALVVNTASRRGAESFELVRETLPEYGVDLGACHAVEDPATLPAVVKDAVFGGHRLVVVGGGDGTVGAAAGVLADLPAGARPALGVLPLGTANDFARTLDIPTTVAGACATLARGKVVDVDLGRANGTPFLNVASLGLSVGVARALRPGLKKRLGPVAYPIATLVAYRRHRPFRARLEFPHGDTEPFELDDLLQVAVGNGRHYGGGNTVHPDAGIDDHRLDVYAIRAGRLRDHVNIARLLKDGSFIEHAQVQHVSTRAVRVTTDDGDPAVNLDGEIGASAPVLFEVERNALDVVVPSYVTHVRADGAARARVAQVRGAGAS